MYTYLDFFRLMRVTSAGLLAKCVFFLSKPNVSANQKWVNPFVKLKIDWQDNRLKLFHLILLFWFRLYKLSHILKHTAINLLRYKYCASVYSCHPQYLCYVIQIQILGLFWFGYMQRSAVASSENPGGHVIMRWV